MTKYDRILEAYLAGTIDEQAFQHANDMLFLKDQILAQVMWGVLVLLWTAGMAFGLKYWLGL